MINRFLHSRSAVVVMFLLATLSAWYAMESGHVRPIVGNRGIAIASPNEWISPGKMSFVVSIVFNGLIALLSLFISKNFNPMRSSTSLFATFFLLFQAASPWILASFSGGTLLSIIIIGCSILLFSIFQNPNKPQRVFLIFFLLSLATLSQYAFAFYIPMAFIGLAQNKIFNIRNVVAAVLGIITPLWILIGFGIVGPENFEWPDMVNIFSAYASSTLLVVLVTSLTTAVLGFAFLAMNFIKMLSYNSRIRAANGFFTALMISTVVFAVFDYSNIVIYLPLLNWLVAYQAAHYFATNTQRRAYWGIIAVIAVYFSFYAWNIIV